MSDTIKEIISRDEFKDIKEIIGNGKEIKIIGDALYGMDKELIKIVKGEGMIPIFKIGDGIHNKVRTKERREAKKIYEGNKEIYKMRYNIEGLIGDIKNSFKGYEEAKIYEVANVFVYIKFIAYYDKIDIYFLLYICGHYAIFFEQPHFFLDF